MNAPVEQALSQRAQVDQAAVQPFPNSRKVYVEGSRADIRVPMREITLSDTPTAFGGENNPPVYVYDTSGPYTDPAVRIDIRQGLEPLRKSWIERRGGVEQLSDLSSHYGRRRAKDVQLEPLRFAHLRQPLRAKGGPILGHPHPAAMRSTSLLQAER